MMWCIFTAEVFLFICIMAHFAKKNHVKKIIVHSHGAKREHKTLKYRI